MNNMIKNSFGLVQIPIMIGLLLMAVAIPAVTSLVQQNQENRGRAMETCVPACGSGYVCKLGDCVKTGITYPTAKPTVKPTDKPLAKPTVTTITYGECMKASNNRAILCKKVLLIDSTNCGSVGTICLNNSSCVNGVCIFIPRPSPSPTINQNSRPNGTPCVWDTECLSGACSFVGTKKQCIAKKPLNAICNIDNDCLSGVCRGEGFPNNRCVSSANNRANGDFCISNSDCASNVCSPVTSGGNKCRAKQLNNTSCQSDNVCASGYCSDSGICVSKKLINNTCVNDNECVSNLCNGTVGDTHCVSGTSNRGGGETCVWDNECASNVCGGTVGNRKCI
jgi:hypothetical protein